jgi:hypothetical protein
LFKQAEEPMLILQDGVILRLNQPAIKLFDSPEKQMLSCHLRDIVIRESLPKLHSWLANDRGKPLFVFVAQPNDQCFPLRLNPLCTFVQNDRCHKVVELWVWRRNSNSSAVAQPGCARAPIKRNTVRPTEPTQSHQ